jgi:hypothetical protein
MSEPDPDKTREASMKEAADMAVALIRAAAREEHHFIPQVLTDMSVYELRSLVIALAGTAAQFLVNRVEPYYPGDLWEDLRLKWPDEPGG